MPTTTNFGWTTPADTDLVKDGASAMRTLGNGIDTSLVYLKGGTTGQILSKTSNTDLAFTWINNDQGDLTAITAGTGISVTSSTGPVPTVTNSMATEITAAGDIIVGTGSATFDNLPIGTTGQVLTADTTVSPYKVKWATVSSGGMTLISETVASAVSSLSFSSLGSYKQLLLVWNGIKHSATGNRFTIRFNSDGNNNYVHSIQGSITGSSYGGACDSWSGVGEQNFPTFGNNANSATVADACSGFLLLDNYTSTTKYKFFNAESYWKETSGVTSLRYIGYYASTSAITSIDITQIQGSGTFSNNSNTTIRLYGVS